LVKKIKQKTFGQYLSFLPKPRPGDRLLDCGAATGYLVELAGKQGWEGYAVEISKFGADACKNILGADHVYQGDMHDARFGVNPEGLFEAITMIDFIEHLRDPRSSMQWARAHLCPGGRLLLVTPNSRSLSHRLMGKRWAHYKNQHLWYFNPDNLSTLLRELGFTVGFAQVAPKTLSLQYVFHQFRVYNDPIFTPIFNCLHHLLPTWAKRVSLTFSFGDMLVVAHV
jgi:SAM-dependent methyltransferase